MSSCWWRSEHNSVHNSGCVKNSILFMSARARRAHTLRGHCAVPLAELTGIQLRPFTPHDAAAATDLIGRAMNLAERDYAIRTFAQYFASQAHAIPDGRELFVLDDAGAIVAVTGLHHYLWGPPRNVWLSWFALDPAYHGHGIGARLLHETESLARGRGYTRLLIETYSSPPFARARAFYTARGFEEIGAIKGYMPDGADMVVYCKHLG